jgi:hypothetical protein
MQWKSEVNGHSAIVSEVGADLLVATCLTCDKVLGRLTQSEYPKFRLAWHAANKLVQEHSC